MHRPADPVRHVPLVHVDAYRLAGAVELDDLDLDTDLAAAAVVVEWGEGVAEQLADDRLTIELTRLPDDTANRRADRDRTPLAIPPAGARSRRPGGRSSYGSR